MSDRKVKKNRLTFFIAVIMVCSMLLAGCAEPVPKEAQETKLVYGGYTERIVKDLYGAKLDYIGDHVGVGEIMSLLPLPEGVTNNVEGLELFTDVTPYGVMRHLNWVKTGETVYKSDGESYEDDRWFRIHGMIFLALVDNADHFSYELHLENGKGSFRKVFNRDMAKECFGDMDLREFAKDEETFMNFVFAINRYYYEGITTPEQIIALSELDDEAAQTRMQKMFSEAEQVEEISYSGIDKEDMSYQMIHADSLVYAIANEQGLTSSDPLDYINCAEYEELVKMGEPALREFLATFAEGHAGDGLEGYIMMFACQDILGESGRTDLKPTEWYQLYAALDSTLAVNFVYDEKVYTQELEKKYNLGIRKANKWSIIRAGEDDRIRAVYDVIESRYNEKGVMLSHEANIYAPYIHKIHEEGKRMQVFVTIFEEKYVLTRTKLGYGFFERSGSVIPTRLDFEKQYDKWVLQEWTQAMDGSYYDDSIREMCKGHIGLASEMMRGGDYHMLMWQNIIYYMNAHYGGMDIPVYVVSHTDDEVYEKVSKYINVIRM